MREAQWDRRAYAALALVLLGSIVVVMHAGRDTTFFYDDWAWVTERRDWNFHVLLRDHNGHLSVVPLFVYKLLLEVFGLEYGVFRAVLAGLNALNGLLLFAFARGRVGTWPALGLVAALLFMGPAHEDLVWAFQIGYQLSTAAGLGVLLALGRDTRRWDAVACVLLLVALGSSSIGLPIVASAAIAVLWRGDRLARLWIVALPAALYGAWYLRYGVSEARLENVLDVPSWIAEAAAGAAGAMTGLGADYGPVLVVILAFFVGRALVIAERPPVRLVALAAVPLLFWAATALTRAHQKVDPDDSRYLYPGALMLALLAAEVAAGRVRSARAAALVTAVLMVGALGNVDDLEKGGDGLRSLASGVRASLTALELRGPESVKPLDQPDPIQSQIRAGPYFAAVERYGRSPAYSPAEIPGLPNGDRENIDAALARLGAIGAVPGGGPATGKPAPEVVETTAARTTVQGSCVAVAPTGLEAEIAVAIPADGRVAIVAGAQKVELRVGRFADRLPQQAVLGEVAARSTTALETKPDRASAPWRLGLRSPEPFRACAAR